MKTKKTPGTKASNAISDHINTLVDTGLYTAVAFMIAEHMKLHKIEPTMNSIRAAAIVTAHIAYGIVRSFGETLEQSPEDALSVVSVAIHEAFMKDKRSLYEAHVAAVKRGAKVAGRAKHPKTPRRRK